MEKVIGPEIMGLPFEVFMLMASGVFYLLCAWYVWKPLRAEKSELIGALFAFLVYQAINMFFMGVEMGTKNIIYSNIAALAVFVGSAYMLKFPLSPFSRGVRRVLFYGYLLVVLILFTWFMQTTERQMELMKFTLYYDLVINGVIVGGFMILLAIQTTERWLRIKATGGGVGVLSCCIAANTSMLLGAMVSSLVFGFLAPVFILGSLVIAKKGQRK